MRVKMRRPQDIFLAQNIVDKYYFYYFRWHRESIKLENRQQNSLICHASVPNSVF